MNAYAKFRCASLRIKKALGIFRELIPRTRRTTRVAFWDHPPSGSKNLDKSKMAQTFPRARVSKVPIFSWKGQRSRSQDVKKHKTGVMFTYGRSNARRIRHRLQTRPAPLLGLTYCRRLRRSATGLTAAYHVCTRPLGSDMLSCLANRCFTFFSRYVWLVPELWSVKDEPRNLLQVWSVSYTETATR